MKNSVAICFVCSVLILAIYLRNWEKCFLSVEYSAGSMYVVNMAPSVTMFSVQRLDVVLLGCSI